LKKIMVLIMALALLALTVGMAPAETYVGGYFGSNFTVTAPNPFEFKVNPLYKPIQVAPEYPRTVTYPLLIGGVKFGTWFSKEGYPGFDYPDWMKYFGFYLDFNIHGFNFYREVGSRRMYVSPVTVPPGTFSFQHYKFLGSGTLITLGFMFAARYGFFPTEKVPFGKLQPYAAVGPALFITTFSPTLMFQPVSTLVFPAINTINEYSASSKTAVSPGLEAELGLRYMFTRENGPKDRAISFETSVKYRYVRPTLNYDLDAEGFTHQLRFTPQFNIFSIQMGLAYHF
jgi:hypothetical protein